VQAGLVRLTSRIGGRDVVVRVAKPGELIGDSVLRGGMVREATADVLADCTVVEIEAEEFLERSRSQPKFWRWMTEQLERRVADVELRIRLISFYRVKERLLLVLADLSRAFPGRDPILPLTQNELAQLTGATRETTSTALNELEREGLVELGRRSVRLVDAERLRGWVRGLLH
jgi:CRP-like cAMP-binding protein